MKHSTLQSRITYLLVGGKILVVFYVFFHYLAKGFSMQQVLETLAIVVPLFAVHLTIILKYYFEDGNGTVPAEAAEELKVRQPMVVLSLLLPMAYLAYLLIIITLKPIHWGSDAQFSVFKNLLGLGETMFGVYLGQIITAMFRVRT